METLEEKVVKEVTTFTSKIFTLKTRDFLKGLLVAVFSPVFTIIITSINAGHFDIDFKAIKITVVSSFFAYLAKNFFEPTKTVILVDPAIKGVSTTEQTQIITTNETK